MTYTETRLMRGFDRNRRIALAVLTSRYDAEQAKIIWHNARCEFYRLIPDLPYIGGDANPLTWNLVASAWFLALYKAMKLFHKPVDEIGAVIQEMHQRYLKSIPSFLMRLRGRWQLTQRYFKQLDKRAERSQRRFYPDDWIYRAVKGDGKTFDYGVDYTQCGICQFFWRHDAGELLPYLCQLDYATVEAMGLQLTRTTTLAEGGAKCDFRLKRVS